MLIDTAKSFVYTEDGLKGVLEMTSVHSLRAIVFLDIGQQWRQDGAEKIELKHRDEICTLNPILDKLVREGRIKMTVEKQGDIVSLISG